MTGQLMKMIWHVHISIRPRLLELLATVRSEKRVIDIRSPRQLRHFMRVHGA